MYKGTYDGDLEEINFVKDFNSNKNKFKKYLNNFLKYKNPWMVRVTTKQFSSLSEKKVFTRSDCYLANISSNITEILKSNNFLLTEDILNKNKIFYKKIPYSGISIKMANSKNFQILKLTPNSFNKLFNCNELGAGASLYCKRENELFKNLDLIKGWNTNLEDMTKYFINFTSGNEEFYLNKDICSQIKSFSSNEIKNIIETDKNLQEQIFNGISLYEEPYTAHYFYQGNDIKKLTKIPFYITTGSGRSSGNYTIVLKPQNE